MFQYACGLAVAKRNGARLVLDTTYLNDRFPRPQFSYRTYDLGIFALNDDAHFTALSRASFAAPIPGVWLGLDLVLMQGRAALGSLHIIKEKQEHVFDPAVLAARGNVLLWGRWQTEKYFEDVARDVRAAFRFRASLTGEAAHVAEEIATASTRSVSLHVRRGDYAAFKGVEALHGKTDLGYYDRAAAYVASRVQSPHFFIFSDDISWCRENLKLPFPATFVDSSAAGPHAAFHLELMSRCAHHIITNSTFSWWGAWLDARAGKIVVAPKRWYADPGMWESGMVSSMWTKL